MSTFTETMDGHWVNLDHAMEIKYRAHNGGWTAILVNGDAYRLGFGFDPETLAAHQVPAAAGMFILYVSFPDDDDANGTPFIERSPLVAWRVDGGRGATPIAFAFDVPLKAVEYPNGTIYTDDALTFSGLGEYIDHRRMEWREETKEHAAKFAAEVARAQNKGATS